MSHTRLVVWGKKNGKGHSSSPDLASLPPTREAFIENVNSEDGPFPDSVVAYYQY